jgi:hypothetical protein
MLRPCTHVRSKVVFSTCAPILGAITEALQLRRTVTKAKGDCLGLGWREMELRRSVWLCQAGDSAQAHQTLECVNRINPAADAPLKKFSNVDASVGAFRFVYPTLRLTKPLGQRALGQFGSFSHLPEKLGSFPVGD